MLTAAVGTLELARPVLLIGLLALPWLLFWWHRSLVDLAYWQRALSLGVRSLLILCLVLALAGLNLLWPTQPAIRGRGGRPEREHRETGHDELPMTTCRACCRQAVVSRWHAWNSLGNRGRCPC